jgi:transcriptional regulator with GAF, ATPase, and Fis domain
VAPVTRRTITDEERAALSDEPDVRVVAVASRERIVSTEAKRRAASLRGAQMAAARWDTLARHSMPTIWQAIRDADGVVYQAAQALGQDPANVRRRVRGHIDEAPDDVRALLAQHRGRQRSPATRALMSIRGRERWAMRKAVAA